jgi:NitT/TauT family transport system substrate-binding protein
LGIVLAAGAEREALRRHHPLSRNYVAGPSRPDRREPKPGRLPMTIIQTRRRVITVLSLSAVLGLPRAPRSLAAEGALETTTVRLVNDRSICIAPVFVGEELLRAEGFNDVRYVEVAAVDIPEALARAKVDFGALFGPQFVSATDAGKPITLLAGLHVGCFELLAREGVHSIADLKGKKVGLKSAPPELLRLMAAQVGLEPERDIRWVTDPALKPMELFAEGKIDAFLGFPPEPQELRDRHVGHVIVNTTLDRPWSQYFCCMLAGNREYVRQHPVATKRVLRAMLKAADLCGSDPTRAAQRIVDGGFTAHYDYAFETLSDIPFDIWREYDAEDTSRLYALRMREAGTIKSSPQKIIADGTDWRFLNELKRELKA